MSLTDGDAGGVDIREKLASGGVDTRDVFHLGQVRAGCSLEDIVDAAVLAEAINRELDTWNIGPLRVADAELPPTGRWTWLEAQGVATGTPIERLSKPCVAQRVVDIGREARAAGSPRALLNVADITKMQDLHEALCSAMGLAPRRRHPEQRTGHSCSLVTSGRADSTDQVSAAQVAPASTS